MRTSVDLPAPFSPSSATIEPPAASRSTPWRTSTPPNDFRTPWALRRRVTGPGAFRRLLAGARVDGPDVRLRDDAVVDVDGLRLRLAVDQRQEERDERVAALLGEVGRVVD